MTLEHIDIFFGRLKQYTKVGEELDMLKDIIMKMMVKVLGVLATMTKEMEQGQASELIPDDTCSVTDRDLVTYGKKFAKALVGKEESIEATLSRMDGLTGQEVVTVIAQHRLDQLEQRMEGTWKEVMGLDVKVTQHIEGMFIMPVTHKCHLKPTYD
jgi:hypothetical protein